MGSRIELKKQISRNLEENIQAIYASTAASMDIVVRRFRLGNGQEAAAFFIDVCDGRRDLAVHPQELSPG